MAQLPQCLGAPPALTWISLVLKYLGGKIQLVSVAPAAFELAFSELTHNPPYYYLVKGIYSPALPPIHGGSLGQR